MTTVYNLNTFLLFENSGFHSNGDRNSGFVGNNAMSICMELPIFMRNVLLPSSGQSKKSGLKMKAVRFSEF
jgi:hypothetical protein